MNLCNVPKISYSAADARNALAIYGGGANIGESVQNIVRRELAEELPLLHKLGKQIRKNPTVTINNLASNKHVPYQGNLSIIYAKSEQQFENWLKLARKEYTEGAPIVIHKGGLKMLKLYASEHELLQ